LQKFENFYKMALHSSTVILSGKFSVPRYDIEALITYNGGKVIDEVPKKRSGSNVILLVGDNPKQGKTNEAKLNSVPVIQEHVLWQVIDGSGKSSSRMFTLAVREAICMLSVTLHGLRCVLIACDVALTVCKNLCRHCTRPQARKRRGG
jgi:hypothetical protein